MKTLRHSAGSVFVMLLASAFAMAQNNFPNEHHGPEAAKRVPGATYVRDGNNTSYPAFVRLASGSDVRAENFSSWLKQTLRVADGVDFVLYKQSGDDLGMTHYRYRQTYNGVPVDNATYIAHVRNGALTSFNGYAADIPSTNVSSTPVLSEGDALTKAKARLGYAKYMWEDPFWENDLKQRKNDPTATHFPKATLCWFVDNGNFVLAYKFDLDVASPTKFERVYLDANNGSLLKTLPMQSNCSPVQFNHIFEGTQWISTDQFTMTDFRLRDNCQDAVIHIRNFNSLTTTANPVEIQNTSNSWTTNNERLGGSALWGMEVSTEYYAEAHGRDAYDDNGGDVSGMINALFDCGPSCISTNNASMTFNGGNLLVGSGNTGNLNAAWSTLDILGHEYTHAVTGSTAALEYEGESGALNESFSDIFGEAIESYWNGTPDWLVGNQRGPGAIRDLMNPNNFGHPDTYLGTNWFTIAGTCDDTSNNDRCGVHTNSGVQNFWFYLLSQGGSGTNDNGETYNVVGLGIDQASHIAYGNLVDYLSEHSSYADARDGAIQTVIEMTGECSWEVEQVTNAWHAVGVGGKYLTVDLTTSNYNGYGTTCHNTCDGSIYANVSGGTGVYTVAWNTGSNQYTIDNLCQGTYLVTVYEVGGPGCGIVTNEAVISPPPPVTAFAAPTTVYHAYNISCFGGNDGGADVEANGGTSTYAYQWSNGDNSVDVSSLSAGSYDVTVTDANDCLVVATAFLIQPTQLTTTASITSNYNGYSVRCNGGSDGAAAASPSGGVPPYTYQWSPGGQTSASPNNLSAGLNTVVVTDANGCTASASVTLTQPPALFVDGGLNKMVYRGYPDSACAKLKATGGAGGVPPYSYAWSNGASGTQQTVCPIASTVYKVTISDGNNCSVKDSVRVCVIDVRCGNNLNKVTLCHKDVTGLKTQCISLADVHNHLAHGDRLGACGINRNCTFGTSAREEEIEFNGEAFIQAFPNPFTNTTTLRFVLPTDSRGELTVYDVAGRQIQTLFDGDIESGNVYEVSFDANGLSDGMYIYRLTTTDGNVFNGKLILTK